MPRLGELLVHLKTEGVLEFAVKAGRFPCVLVDGGYRPVSDVAATAVAIRAMLVELAEGDVISKIGSVPIDWEKTIPSLGDVSVSAVQKGDMVQARISLVRRKRWSTLPPATEEIELAAAPLRAPRRAAPVVRTLETILGEARRRHASDLHLVAGRPPLFRVAGELTPDDDGPIAPERVEELLRGVVPERLVPALEGDGACDFALELPGLGRFRVNVSRQRTGWKGSFRLIVAEIPTLASLGLPKEIANVAKHHQGVVVVTGPAGHGKTSTLAAIVDLINETTHHHVLTVEDPVEHVHARKSAMISQREVGTHTRSFGSALKASLREDPDVIVVGELRDLETVRMALSAGETGHLVIGTMNTPSAAKTIDRLIDLFPPADQQQVRMTLAGALRMIVGQRLVPSVDRTELHVAAEVLPGSIALWNLIREGKTYQIPSLQQRGKSLGILRLDDALGELVQAQKITLETALAFAESPDDLATRLKAPAQPAAPAPQPQAPGLLGRAGALFGKK